MPKYTTIKITLGKGSPLSDGDCSSTKQSANVSFHNILNLGQPEREAYALFYLKAFVIQLVYCKVHAWVRNYIQSEAKCVVCGNTTITKV